MSTNHAEDRTVFCNWRDQAFLLPIIFPNPGRLLNSGTGTSVTSATGFFVSSHLRKSVANGKVSIHAAK
jgi:hypothetical protein